jgi:acyl carrier protein
MFMEECEFETCTSLQRVFCGGESLSVEIRKQFFNHSQADLCNLYGPTETCIDTTFWVCQPDDNFPTVPIGKPIANTRAYVVDAQLQLAPVGVAGELLIGGAGLARGYLHRPGLTAEKFIPDPFGTEPGARLYRSGDLVRYLAGGELEYLGRIDQQVKLRGFRIELGEIEAGLTAHALVKEAVVVAQQGGGSGSERLVAYVVRQPEATTIGAGELRSHLGGKLPDYMLPSAYVFLDALPLLPNGKIDRRALPPPELLRAELEETFVAPRTAVEEIMVSIWAEVLGVEQVGVHDNFFTELGGHSLLATQLSSRVRNTFQVELPLQRLFESPTVAGLTEVMVQNPENRLRVEKTAQLLLTMEQLSEDEVDSMLNERARH